MLYLGYVLLRYVLIYNLEVSFNFHLTFLQLNVIKMFTVQSKLFFTLLSAIFFDFFSLISLEGSSDRESTVLNLNPCCKIRATKCLQRNIALYQYKLFILFPFCSKILDNMCDRNQGFFLFLGT